MRKIASGIKQKLIRAGVVKPGKQTVIKAVANEYVFFNADITNINHFAGWAFARAEQAADEHVPATVKLLIGDVLIAETVASLPREDIVNLKLGPRDCGFHLQLNWRHFNEGHNRCKILVNDTLVAQLQLYVSIKDLLVGQANELSALIKH